MSTLQIVGISFAVILIVFAVALAIETVRVYRWRPSSEEFQSGGDPASRSRGAREMRHSRPAEAHWTGMNEMDDALDGRYAEDSLPI